MNIPYVPAREDQRYQELVLALLRINADRDTDVLLQFWRGVLVVKYPYYRLYWLHRLVCSADSMTKVRVRRNQAYVIGWHNYEIH